MMLSERMCGVTRKALAAVVASFMLMTGCTIGTEIDTLLVPPRLSSQQASIKQALTDKVGKNIKFKYPRSGDYRSAFVIANIDSEPTEEAIVFYQKMGINATDANIRMNILDQKDGKWVSVFDHSGAGAEVERILLTRLTDTAEVTIIVGYALMGKAQRVLEAYSYDDGRLSSLYAGNYSALDVLDLDMDGVNEMVVIDNSAAGKSSARMLKKAENSLEVVNEVELAGDTAEYTAVVRGVVGAASAPALFIDGARADGTLQTQLLYCVRGALYSPFKMGSDVLEKTTRPIGYASRDIDNNGTVEIPTLSPFPGYETLERAEQLFVTDWMSFQQGTLVKQSSALYSITGGYCFILPNRWRGTVTIKKDLTTDETVFYRYDGELSENMTELMRIGVIKTSEISDAENSGYVTIISSGDICYIAKSPTGTSEPLVLTNSEILYNFLVI